MTVDKQIDESATHVGMIAKAIKVGIFPPWLIETFKDQVKASIWIIVVDCVLLFVNRYFAPYSSAGVSTFGVLMNFAVSVVPIVLAVVVNAFFPRQGEETLKRWINFLSVSFLYCLVVIFVVVAVPAIVSLPEHPVNWLQERLGIGLSATLWLITAAAALASIAFMYLRMRSQFRVAARRTPGLLAFAFIVCWAGLAALSYFAVFTNF
jgi:hypothetical protein